MLKVAHIINPFMTPENSEQHTAQTITYETMRRARAFSKDFVDVQLLTAQFPEDKPIIPGYFEQTRDLDRSVLDVSQLHTQKKLPLIKDILERLAEHTDADYLIYSNADIALQPYFYTAIAKLIARNIDCALINRKTIQSAYNSISQLDEMYSAAGMPHEGIDCFMFRKEYYPHFYFANSCIGSGPVGLCFALNISLNCTSYAWLEKMDLTFHIGDDKSWAKGKYNKLIKYNFRQYLDIIDHYSKQPDSCMDNRARILRSARKFAHSKLRQLSWPGLFEKLYPVRDTIHPKTLLREGSVRTDLHID